MNNYHLKTCEICLCKYQPDYRTQKHQRVCQKPQCKKERKRIDQIRWLVKNPRYFKDRYRALKDKIQKYQMTRRSLFKANSKDKLTFILNVFKQIRKNITLKYNLKLKISICIMYLIQLQKPFYKTNEPIVIY
jgi:hypothetical protein